LRENIGAHRKDVRGAGKVAEVWESGQRCGKIMVDAERRSGMWAEGQKAGKMSDSREKHWTV
jgi:hypothetical protein